MEDVVEAGASVSAVAACCRADISGNARSFDCAPDGAPLRMTEVEFEDERAELSGAAASRSLTPFGMTPVRVFGIGAFRRSSGPEKPGSFASRLRALRAG
jgi:hypothetical protein